MISPTGEGVRMDTEGSGVYGAPRGSRKHNGVDYLCDAGQPIVAPFDMKIERVANPKARSPLSGVKWRAGRSHGKIFYFMPAPGVVGRHVKQGEIIGVAQSVSKDYGLPAMLDHIHFQIDK